MAGIPQIATYPMPTAGELPDHRVRWSADPDRAVLLLHDMQRFFLAPFPEGMRERLVSRVAQLRDQARERGVPVAYTAQPGGMTPEQRGLLVDFWGPGMSTTAEDRSVVDALAPEPGDWQLTKWRYSAFVRTDLLARMREHGRDQLIVAGVYAHVGVLMTCVDAFSHDIRPFLVADAVADFTEHDHRTALDYAARTCARVTLTKEVFG